MQLSTPYILTIHSPLLEVCPHALDAKVAVLLLDLEHAVSEPVIVRRRKPLPESRSPPRLASPPKPGAPLPVAHTADPSLSHGRGLVTFLGFAPLLAQVPKEKSTSGEQVELSLSQARLKDAQWQYDFWRPLGDSGDGCE